MSVRTRVLIAGVSVVVLGGLLALRLTRHSEIPLARATRDAFTISLKRSGEIKAMKSLTVGAPSVGERLIITRLIAEGTFVKKGDFLVQFDPTEMTERLDTAGRELVGARADLGLVRARGDLALREMEEDVRKKELALAKAEGLAPVDVENAERDLELANLRRQAQLAVTDAEVTKTEVNISRAEERLATARRSLGELTVLAPGDGLVVHEKVWRGGAEEKVQEGDSPWPGQPIISLPDLGTLYVKSDIDETDISRIAIGDRALITLEAYPDSALEGRVAVVGNLARTKYYGGGPNIFDVSIDLAAGDDRLRPGMLAKVEIIVEVLENTVSIPIEAVFEKDGKPAVYVKRGRGFAARTVEVGKRNDTHVAVLSGLAGTEEVALRDPTEKEEG